MVMTHCLGCPNVLLYYRGTNIYYSKFRNVDKDVGWNPSYNLLHNARNVFFKPAFSLSWSKRASKLALKIILSCLPCSPMLPCTKGFFSIIWWMQLCLMFRERSFFFLKKLLEKRSKAPNYRGYRWLRIDNERDRTFGTLESPPYS